MAEVIWRGIVANKVRGTASSCTVPRGISPWPHHRITGARKTPGNTSGHRGSLRGAYFPVVAEGGRLGMPELGYGSGKTPMYQAGA